MRHSLAVIGPPPQRKRFAPCSRVSSFPQPICQRCESQIGPCLLGAARVGEDFYHVKVGQLIHRSEIQQVRTPAPVVRTLSPFLRGMHSRRFHVRRGRGGKYVLHFPTLFRRRRGCFTIYLHASKVREGQRAERCHHCRNELFSNSNFLIIAISVL